MRENVGSHSTDHTESAAKARRVAGDWYHENISCRTNPTCIFSIDEPIVVSFVRRGARAAVLRKGDAVHVIVQVLLVVPTRRVRSGRRRTG